MIINKIMTEQLKHPVISLFIMFCHDVKIKKKITGLCVINVCI